MNHQLGIKDTQQHNLHPLHIKYIPRGTRLRLGGANAPLPPQMKPCQLIIQKCKRAHALTVHPLFDTQAGHNSCNSGEDITIPKQKHFMWKVKALIRQKGCVSTPRRLVPSYLARPTSYTCGYRDLDVKVAQYNG